MRSAAVIDFPARVRTIAPMTRAALRHLAIVAATAPPEPADPGTAVAACCAKAAELARSAFAAVPGLQAFSWLAPGVDRLPGAGAAAAGAEGARLLARTAAELGAALRLCGRVDDLPPDALPAAAPAARTLLWYRRYGGRDEIVRAAGRFFAAHPGRALDDAGLDEWLDSAGVPDPDLLVFAGGALEPHDVLLWQGSYAEIWHTPLEWPALGDADVRRAVADFVARDRRFGR
jgi:hypothetical protein